MSQRKYYDFDFANNIKRYLAERNMTQSELASRIDVERKSVNAWVNGMSVPNVVLVKRICRVLRITPNDILE